MGCDIHLYTEKKQNNKWISTDRFSLNSYYSPQDVGEKEYEVEAVYSDRDYAAFEALAGVREGGQIVEKLPDPRGFPGDCNNIIQQEHSRWDGDGHSHSWFTLQELYDYQDKCPTFKHSGLISPEQQERLAGGDNPTEWCQGTTMEGYKRAEWDENHCVLERLIKKVGKRAMKEMWIFHEDRVLKEKAENFRIVFWFDN